MFHYKRQDDKTGVVVMEAAAGCKLHRLAMKQRKEVGGRAHSVHRRVMPEGRVVVRDGLVEVIRGAGRVREELVNCDGGIEGWQRDRHTGAERRIEGQQTARDELADSDCR